MPSVHLSKELPRRVLLSRPATASARTYINCPGHWLHFQLSFNYKLVLRQLEVLFLIFFGVLKAFQSTSFPNTAPCGSKIHCPGRGSIFRVGGRSRTGHAYRRLRLARGRGTCHEARHGTALLFSHVEDEEEEDMRPSLSAFGLSACLWITSGAVFRGAPVRTNPRASRVSAASRPRARWPRRVRPPAVAQTRVSWRENKKQRAKKRESARALAEERPSPRTRGTCGLSAFCAGGAALLGARARTRERERESWKRKVRRRAAKRIKTQRRAARCRRW